MKKILLVLVFALLLFTCVACDSKEDKGVDLSGIKFESTQVEYDGEEHSIAIKGTLPKNYSVHYFGNKAVVTGKHLVTAVIYDENGKEVARLTAYIDVLASDFVPEVDVEDLEYYVLFDEDEYTLEYDDSNEDDSYLQYYVSEVDVTAGQIITVIDPDFNQITDIHDERKGSSNTNNAFGEGSEMEVLVDGTVDVYLRVYEDGTYSLWITGNDEEKTGGTADEVSDIITIYFSNNKFWEGDIYAYVWASETEDKPADWPGTKMTLVGKNEYTESIYSINVDISLYDMIIFTNGSVQSPDTVIVIAENVGYYNNDNLPMGTYEFDPSFIVS